MGDPPDKDKRTKNRKRNGEEANSDDILEDEVISKILKSPKRVTTFRLNQDTKDFIEEHGLTGQASAMTREMWAKYQVNNGHTMEQDALKYTELKKIKRNVEYDLLQLEEKMIKDHGEIVTSDREKADKIRKREEGAAHINDLAVIYEDEFKTLLKSGEKRSKAVLQIKDRINTRNLSKFKEVFGEDLTVDELFKKMGLEDVK